MIWHEGHIRNDGDLSVGVGDRVFEHGLGLFETFRAWGGRPPLLPRHLARLREAADELGIPLEGVALPDRQAVGRLVEAEGLGDDAMLRLTVTAGSSDGPAPVAWMSARPLPPAEPALLSVSVDRNAIGRVEGLVHWYKLLNYWGRRMAYERALAIGVDELLLGSPEGWLWEGSRNNVLIVPAGRPRTIVTPSLHGPVLPGIMRRVALDYAAGRGYAIEERMVEIRALDDAEAIFLTNSVRGVRRVGWLEGRPVGSAEMEVDDLTRLFLEELPLRLRSPPDGLGEDQNLR